MGSLLELMCRIRMTGKQNVDAAPRINKTDYLRGPILTHLVPSDSIPDADDENIEPLIRRGDAIVL